jgi:hypothetical protein
MRSLYETSSSSSSSSSSCHDEHDDDINDDADDDNVHGGKVSNAKIIFDGNKIKYRRRKQTENL